MAKRYTITWPSPGIVAVGVPPKAHLTAEDLDEILRSEFPGTPRNQVFIVPSENSQIITLVRKA